MYYFCKCTLLILAKKLAVIKYFPEEGYCFFREKLFYIFYLILSFLIWAFMDLEKGYDTIDRHGMWQMLRVYGVGGKLLKAVQSFYVDSRVCVRVGNG